VEEHVIDVKLRSQLPLDAVSESDAETWFTYLLSGFDRAFAPFLPDVGIAELPDAAKQPEMAD
jgi:hypothetical protein